MNKVFNKIKDGILFGIGLILIIGVSGLAYASFTWITQNDVSSGDNLSAESWNDMINNQNYLKQEVEGVVDTNTQLTESEVDAYVANNGYAISSASVPTGAVMAFYLSSCPTGWIVANGSNSSPDLRGTFIRGDLGEQNGRDISRGLGSYKTDSFKSHTHAVRTNSNPGSSTPNNYPGYSASHNSYNYTSAIGAVATGGSETSPKNVVLLYCMKQ